MRGHIFKYVLLNQDKLALEGYSFTAKNVYVKLFGFHRDHSSALHYKNTVDFVAGELHIYNKMIEYINSYDIEWYDRTK